MKESKIPNFFVVGVVKGGTTSLYNYLEQHPQVYMPPIKETNHFASADIDHNNFLPEYATDVRVDLDAFIASGMKRKIHIAHVDDKEHYHALFKNVVSQSAVGEVSNSYMICPSAATAIHNFNPEAKIIVVLRNPVSRIWSQYLMNLREAKNEHNEFIAEIKADHHRVRKGWGVNHQYLELGLYASQLRPYLALFGKENVLVLFYEEYRAKPELTMGRICRFLKIGEDFAFDFSRESNKASMPRHSGLNSFLVKSGIVKTVKEITPKSLRTTFAKILYQAKSIPGMSAQDREWLVHFYQDEVNSLKGLLDEDPLTHWPEFRSKEV